MKIVLFVNDSYFSYLLAKPTVELFYNNIELVSFSNMITGSYSRIISIYKKTHFRYFCYRTLVDIISRINNNFNNKSVSALVRKYDLEFSVESNVNKNFFLKKKLHSDLGLAFNFDQVLNRQLLDFFKSGILNVHASKLPNDKGISPVLWAFARGDKKIWVSIYKMGAKIDTGLVYKQFYIPVTEEMTVFSMYEMVCFKAGYELAEMVKLLLKQPPKPLFESKETEGNYWGWPNETHKRLMSNSGRKFINFKDILNAISMKSTHLSKK